MRIKFFTERAFGLEVKKWLISQGEQIVAKKPDIVIVCYYPKIIKKEEFENAPFGAINFHPGYLPYNRGMYPHIWPLVDGSSAGVTIHYIGDKVDSGDIIGQVKIRIKPTDIASDYEKRTRVEIFKLFKKLWPKIKTGKARRRKQGKGTYHFAKEISSLDEFDKATIYRLRARTFNDRSYAYFIDNGKKIYVGAKFFKESDITQFAKKNIRKKRSSKK